MAWWVDPQSGRQATIRAMARGVAPEPALHLPEQAAQIRPGVPMVARAETMGASVP
jgi:hypothetical protein